MYHIKNRFYINNEPALNPPLYAALRWNTLQKKVLIPLFSYPENTSISVSQINFNHKLNSVSYEKRRERYCLCCRVDQQQTPSITGARFYRVGHSNRRINLYTAITPKQWIAWVSGGCTWFWIKIYRERSHFVVCILGWYFFILFFIYELLKMSLGLPVCQEF